MVWALLGIVAAPATIALVATALSAISYEVGSPLLVGEKQLH